MLRLADLPCGEWRIEREERGYSLPPFTMWRMWPESSSGAACLSPGTSCWLMFPFLGFRPRFTCLRFAHGLDIDLLRNFGELLVSFLFFIERLFKEVLRFLLAQKSGPGLHTPVSCDFVVFYPLSGGNESGVLDSVLKLLVHHFVAFLDEPDHRSALFAAGPFAHSFKDLTKPIDVAPGLLKMFLDAGTQFLRYGLLRELRKNLYKPIFSVIEVPQFVDV